MALWLEALGYQVRRNDGLVFGWSDKAALMFVYPNQLTYTEADAQHLRTWVEAGNTLVIVGPDRMDAALVETFGVAPLTRDSYGTMGTQVQPLLGSGPRQVEGDWLAPQAALDLRDTPTAVTVLRGDDGAPVVAVQPVGEGEVWHLAQSFGMSNRGLQDDGQGDLLPPILRTVPDGAVIVFDTFHQFGLSRVGERIRSLQDWLYRTPTGWATALALGVTGLYLVLQGRRLGPPVRSVAEQKQREAAEYVHAMAGLMRRARLSGDVAHYQKQRLKRGLSHLRPISADIADVQFVERLRATDPPLSHEEVAEIRDLLKALDAKPDDRRLVELAAQIDQLLARQRKSS
ncbi:MAG: DUF4350 domain-containing protein [Anaerolineales bacterium]|nr:DUF4350 domain-containing protein [Anaerolineales bacterium]